MQLKPWTVGLSWMLWVGWAEPVSHAQTSAPEQAAKPVAAPLVPPAEVGQPIRSSSGLDVGASIDAAGYVDSDHVIVLTPVIAGRVSSPTAGWSVDGSYLVDVVSAASVDIVSTASQNYTEVRQAGTLNAAYKPRDLGGALNASVSSEPDYLSWTAGGSLTQDLLDKNLTLFEGFFHGHDTAGRTGTPFSVFANQLDIESFKLGLTRVLDRRTLASVVADAVIENGNQSKPYRYVPLFAPGTSVPDGASVATVTGLRLAERPLEQLPLSRDRYALSFRIAHRFGGWSTLRADERVYVDTWALKATTSHLRFLIDASSRIELGPHARFHAQSPVSFWERAYTLGPGFSFPVLRTGDRELGPLVGATLGGSFRVKLGPLAHRTAWVVGLDANVTETHYLDDIYITNRLSLVTGLSLEAEL